MDQHENETYKVEYVLFEDFETCLKVIRTVITMETCQIFEISYKIGPYPTKLIRTELVFKDLGLNARIAGEGMETRALRPTTNFFIALRHV